MTTNRSIALDNGTTTFKQDFNWDSKTQGTLLSTFSFGYITTLSLGGWLATRVGGSTIFGLGLAATSVTSLLIPVVVRANDAFFFFLLVLQGIFAGLSFTSLHAMWAHWAPPAERATLSNVSFAGNSLGIALTFPVSGWLADHAGWPSVYYVFGSFGLLWFIIWRMVIKERPEEDPFISPEELKYITNSMVYKPHKNIVYPWKNIFTSLPFWALTVPYMCGNWVMYTLLAQIPSFMKDILGSKLEDSSKVFTIPFLVLTILTPCAGRLADWLTTKKNMSVTLVRKLYCCVADLLGAAVLFLMTMVHSAVMVETCVALAIIVRSFYWSALCVNALDIAPNHSSIIMGLANNAAAIPSLVSPIVTGYIVQHNSWSEWKTVFYICTGANLIGAVFYFAFGSGEAQSWSIEEHKESDSNAENGVKN
ncbi:vesicular glutamate transporter 1-like [Periplaneta americana]|uniref:vesicular glutamate transporter 1-like n=1 Tax=Periplaneta americana TaxID=6978 RepID=UPI0037E87188